MTETHPSSEMLQEMEPQISDGDHFGLSDRLFLVHEPTGYASEGVGSLRNALLSVREMRTLAVVGPSDSVSPTEIAANLAISIAQSGRRTLLIDGNLRDPVLPNLFLDHDGERRGLGDFLDDPDVAEPEIIHDILPNLSLLFAGQPRSGIADLLVSQRFQSLAKDASRSFDMTIAVSPPSARFGDARQIAALLGNALIVVRKDETRMSKLQDLTAQLKADGTRVIGTFLDGRS